jgi:hypothetical protein
MITKKELEKNNWTVVPKGVWFGVDYAESHAEGYNFVVCAYKKEGDK